MSSFHIKTAAMIFCMLVAQPLLAHEDHCAAVVASITEAGFDDSVSVSCDNSTALIRSDTYPDHELMTGIVGTNEQLAVPAIYAAPIVLNPTLGSTPQSRDAALGVAVNGVPIYDYTGGGEMSEADLYHHQTRHDTILTQQLDICGGHAGRGDDYHYHTSPTCMIEQMENASDAAIIGWAFDGFPIYGNNNPDGTAIGQNDLDVCNGQPDAEFGYRYHTSNDAPYIIQCLMGDVPNINNLPRVAPLKAASGRGGMESGRPPLGGVNNLTFTKNDSGVRSMEYTYQGDSYFMRYSPSGRTDCYDFETRTITNSGNLMTGEYCR